MSLYEYQKTINDGWKREKQGLWRKKEHVKERDLTTKKGYSISREVQRKRSRKKEKGGEGEGGDGENEIKKWTQELTGEKNGGEETERGRELQTKAKRDNCR